MLSGGVLTAWLTWLCWYVLDLAHNKVVCHVLGVLKGYDAAV